MNQGFFQGLGSVPMTNRDPYFSEGWFLAQLADASIIPLDEGGELVKIKCLVVAKSNTLPEPVVGGFAAESYKNTGGKGNYKRQMAQRRWKSFVFAVMGWDPNTFVDEQTQIHVSNQILDGALDGIYLVLECVDRPNKQTPGVHTVHNWKRIATVEDFASFGLAAPEGYQQ